MKYIAVKTKFVLLSIPKGHHSLDMGKTTLPKCYRASPMHGLLLDEDRRERAWVEMRLLMLGVASTAANAEEGRLLLEIVILDGRWSMAMYALAPCLHMLIMRGARPLYNFLRARLVNCLFK